MASQAKQVFYVQDQHDPRWSIVLLTPQKDFLDRERGDDLVDNFIEHHPFIMALPQVEAFDVMDDSMQYVYEVTVRGFGLNKNPLRSLIVNF